MQKPRLDWNFFTGTSNKTSIVLVPMDCVAQTRPAFHQRSPDFYVGWLYFMHLECLFAPGKQTSGTLLPPTGLQCTHQCALCGTNEVNDEFKCVIFYHSLFQCILATFSVFFFHPPKFFFSNTGQRELHGISATAVFTGDTILTCWHNKMLAL